MTDSLPSHHSELTLDKEMSQYECIKLICFPLQLVFTHERECLIRFATVHLSPNLGARMKQ